MGTNRTRAGELRCMQSLDASPLVAAREAQVQAVLAGEGVRYHQPVTEEQRLAAEEEVGGGGGVGGASLQAALAVQDLDQSDGETPKHGGKKVTLIELFLI